MVHAWTQYLVNDYGFRRVDPGHIESDSGTDRSYSDQAQPGLYHGNDTVRINGMNPPFSEFDEFKKEIDKVIASLGPTAGLQEASASLSDVNGIDAIIHFKARLGDNSPS